MSTTTTVAFYGPIAIVRHDFSRASDRFYTLRDTRSGEEATWTFRLLATARRRALRWQRRIESQDVVYATDFWPGQAFWTDERPLSTVFHNRSGEVVGRYTGGSMPEYLVRFSDGAEYYLHEKFLLGEPPAWVTEGFENWAAPAQPAQAHLVEFHPEGEPQDRRIGVLCADHYRTAVSCLMIDRNIDRVQGACVICDDAPTIGIDQADRPGDCVLCGQPLALWPTDKFSPCFYGHPVDQTPPGDYHYDPLTRSWTR